MKRNGKLLDALRFLGLEHSEQISSLPTVPPGTELKIFETSIRTDNAMLCIGYEIFALFEHGSADDASRILIEISCLLELMITLPDYAGNIWGMTWRRSPHALWNVLRRLAREALRMLSLSQATPAIVLEDFITVGKWVPKRCPVSRTCTNAFDALDLTEAGFTPPVIQGDTLAVGVEDVALRPTHPWYVKPRVRDQVLRKAKLIFHGVRVSHRKVQLPITWESDEREEKVLDDGPFVTSGFAAEGERVFRFTGTLWGNDTGEPAGSVEWTIEAKGFELVDEEWLPEE